MSRNNDVFQVLVTKGDQAVLAAGNTVTDLLPGQIGVFNFESNESIDGTKPVRNFYLAVGLDETGAGVTTNIRKSAGSHIQGRNIAFYSYRPFQAGLPQVVEITDIKTQCGKQYGLSINFSSEHITKLQGPVQFSVPFFTEAICCDGCGTGCETGDNNMVVRNFVNAINNSGKGLVKAEMIDPDGDVVTDYDAFVAANKTVNEDDNPDNDVNLGIRITAIPEAINGYSGVDLKYLTLRDTFIQVNMIEGFECNHATIETTQAPRITQGLGYDIQYMEYVAGGWNANPGPYRITGGFLSTPKYYAETAGQYGILALTYDQFSIGGWQEYLNNEAVIVAIPNADTVTSASLLGVIDKLVAPYHFDALADDAAGYSVEDPLTDGLADGPTDAPIVEPEEPIGGE